MVVDLDLESPGLSSAMLEFSTQPEYGVTDWFVEDLVGQSDQVIPSMVGAPQWAQNLDGDVRVVPAHGRDPGEYLPKLGRVFMDAGENWTIRLERMLSRLEGEYAPTVILLESRSGLNDIAASAVTDLGAHVFLFLTDSESNWTGLRNSFSSLAAFWFGTEDSRKPFSCVCANSIPGHLKILKRFEREGLGPVSGLSLRRNRPCGH